MVKRVVGGALLAVLALGAGPARGAWASTGDSVVEPAPAADLAIAISASTPGPYVEHTFEWTVQVTNLGPDAASSVVVSDQVPDLVAVTAVTSDDFSCAVVANAVTCTRAELATGAIGSIRITAMVPDSLTPQTIVDVATVSSLTPDPNPINNSASTVVLTVVVQVGAPDAASPTPPDSTTPATVAPATTDTTIVAPPAAPNFGLALPQTGSDTRPLWPVATVALGLGALLLLLVNRRRRLA